MRRLIKLGLLRLLRVLGVFALMRRITADRVRILCYHGTWRGSDRFKGDTLFMTVQRFRRHLELIRADGYHVVPLDDAVEGLAGMKALPPACTAITIDDGWFSTFADMWPALREMGIPATLYVDTGSLMSGKPVPHVMIRYLLAENGGDVELHREVIARATPRLGGPPLQERVDAAAEVVSALGLDLEDLHADRRFEYMNSDELRAAASEGLDIQLHTRSHLLAERTADEVEREVRMNRADLAELLDRPPEAFRHFCYPSGVHAPTMYEGLRRADVVSATTTVLGLASASSDPLALPRLIMGEAHSDIEFRAELSGVMHMLRSLRRRLSGRRRTGTARPPGVGSPPSLADRDEATPA